MENNYIKDAFDAARSAGYCFNQKQFAEFLGIDRGTINRALKGKPSEKLVLKVEKILTTHGVIVGGNNNGTAIGEQHATPAPQEPQEPQPSTADRLLQEMQAQREMYDRHIAEVLRQNSQLIQIITKNV